MSAYRLRCFQSQVPLLSAINLHLGDQIKSSQKSFIRSRDKNSADTAATEFVTQAINIIVKKYYNAREKN